LEIDFSKETIRRLLDSEAHNPLTGVILDLTPTEELEERVKKLNEEGDKLFMQGNVSAAMATFEAALQLCQHHPLSWYNLGTCLIQMKDLEGAEAAFQRATRYDEKFVNAWNSLGMCLADLNRLDEADDCFDKGILADPEYPKCYYGKGLVAYKRNEIHRARQYFRFAAAKGHDRARAVLQQLEE
jgi:tetratricopeptide (TPR) repeat protein